MRCKMSRIAFLKQAMLDAVHKRARMALPKDWSTADLPLSLPERKAYALKLIFEKMPLYIGEQELIIGTRTIYAHRNEEVNQSEMSLLALPTCVNQTDIERFGRNEQMSAAGHYTANYGKILAIGIGGILEQAETRLDVEVDKDKQDFLKSVLIVYQGLSHLIQRYSEYAFSLANTEHDQSRRKELETIGEVCHKISKRPPENYYEAVQLLWFSHLSLIIESFQFMSYGRIDQILQPFYSKDEHDFQQELTECLIIKMYDGGDIVDGYFGNYAGQHTMTLGGITPEGEDAVNDTTYLLLQAIGNIGLPEPMVEIRYHSKNPEEFLRKAAEISIKGINTLAYYHDDQFIKSLITAGFPEKEANNYAFDLCQDITVAGRAAFYCSASVNLTNVLLDVMKQAKDQVTFTELIEQYKLALAKVLENNITDYNQWEEGILAYNKGEQEAFLQKVREGKLPLSRGGNSIMAPLPLASALFDGCIETATDLTRLGCEIKDKGVIIGGLVVAFNALAAVRKVVFDEKRYTLSQVMKACEDNFEGNEPLRQILWNAPKWGNDDDYVDLPAKEIVEFCCHEILKYRTSTGARHFAGIHQPHPVGDGWGLQATPEGRKKSQPIVVTLSPENGTMENGPTAALKSAAKIDPMTYQWNNCVMLEFFSALFDQPGGAELFCQMLTSYFRMGGAQLQPNIVNIEQLKDAQAHPEKYQDLVVRLWGVSAQFVNLPREVQEEFIARF